MTYYAGIDVSLEYSSVCVVDGAGKIMREQKIASEPEALIAWFRGLGFELERIGLEAGPLSQWLYAAMRAAGLAVELLETRHVRDAFKAMPVKSDRNDARGIAQLMRLGWFRPVHCKSLAAQEVRALLTARRSQTVDIEMSLRGFAPSAPVGPTTPKRFAGDPRALLANGSRGASAARHMRCCSRVCRLARARDAAPTIGCAWMSAPGVGAIVALTYVSAIDDPTRFKSSKGVGAHFGLTPRSTSARRMSRQESARSATPRCARCFSRRRM
jgi:transposase